MWSTEMHILTTDNQPAISRLYNWVLWQVWSPGSWPAGTCTSMPERHIMLAFATLVAAVDLSRITSGLFQRSWPLKEVASRLPQRSMASGDPVWRCTPSPGSELGQEQLLGNSSNVKLNVKNCLFSSVRTNLCNYSCIVIPLRARRDYWENLKPASGRPLCPSLSAPDGWGVTKGHADLMQQKEATSRDQLKQLFDRSKSHWVSLTQTGATELLMTVNSAAPNKHNVRGRIFSWGSHCSEHLISVKTLIYVKPRWFIRLGVGPR